MNRKSTLFFMLLLTFLLGLFSGKSEVYAQEATTQPETKVEIGKEKADAKNPSQEAATTSSGEDLEKNQEPPKVEETKKEASSVEKQAPEELKEDQNSPQNSKDATVKEAQKPQSPSEEIQEADPEKPTSKPETQDLNEGDGKPEAQDPSEDTENLDASEENSEEVTDPEEKDPASEENSEEEKLQALPEEEEEATDIYLNGENGNDENDGSSRDKALKTFDKAKDKARNHKNIKNIYVTGTTSVEGDVNLDETNAKLVRDENFNGYLLRVDPEKKPTLPTSPLMEMQTGTKTSKSL